MSRKNLNGGIGKNDPPFDSSGKNSAAESGDVRITVDFSTHASLGKSATTASLSSQISTSFSSLKNPQIFSKISGQTSFDTLFHDFSLTATPVYNFWVEDEEVNESTPLGSRNLDDTPRYILLSWNMAPIFSPRKNEPSSKGTKNSLKPTKIGQGPEKQSSVVVNGVHFKPAHLQPENFEFVARSVGDGHVSPGLLRSTIESDVRSAQQKTSPINLVDEDSFLSHPDTYGITLSDVVANLKQEEFNGERGTLGSFASASLSSKIQLRSSSRGSLFLSGGGSGKRVNLKISEVQSPSDSNDEVSNLISNSSISRTLDDSEIESRRVHFAYTSLGGALNEERVAGLSRPEHAESIIALSHVVSKLDSLSKSNLTNMLPSKQPPQFPSPADIPQLEYVGYVLEKYKRDSTGNFDLLEQIFLASRDYDQYVDTKVVYGETYRYRIRAVIRWNRPSNVSVSGPAAETPFVHASQVKSAANYISTYFSGHWSSPWVYSLILDPIKPDAPEEIQVRPDSARRQIVVTFKIPNNPRKDISSMRLYRKIQDNSGRDLSKWIQVKESDAVARLVDFDPQNTIYVDQDVDFFQNNSLRYVYAARSFSKHGKSSAFSEQISARLNSDWRRLGEFDVVQVSCRGVSPFHFGPFSTRPFKRMETELVVTPALHGLTKIEEKVRVILSGRSQTGRSSLNDSTYVVRAESLDTGESKDYILSIIYNNVEGKILDSLDEEILAAHVSSLSVIGSVKKSITDEFSDGKSLAGKAIAKANSQSTSLDKNRPRKM